MSDPQPAHAKARPPRAEPLQPDAPGRGNATGSAESVDRDDPTTSPDGAGSSKEEPASARESQAENALKNVTEGYK